MTDTPESPMRKYSKLTVAEQLKVLREGAGYMTHPGWDESQIRVPIDNVDPRTSSVNPSAPKVLTPAPFEDTSVGRGNLAQRSGGNMPPRIPGLQDPMPGQMTGSNMPGSTVVQLPTVTQQYPVQALVVPATFTIVTPQDGSDSYAVQDGNRVSPRNTSFGTIPAARDVPFTGMNPAPTGSPRTAGGQPANDPDYLAKTLAQQMKTPVEMPGLAQAQRLKEDVISDVNLGPATKGLGVTVGTFQLRDQADSKGQAGAGANQTPIGAGMTGDQSRDNPDARMLQTNVPPSQLGLIIDKLKPKEE